MYLIINYPYDPHYASIVMDSSSGFNMVFDSRDTAQSYAEKTMIHEWMIIEISLIKGGTNYHA